ncbi:hypothetical protein [Shewanella sp. YIC-542]|uniref:hypothetical protein n=1 Tax=Shewanella mytili TaxID=3377111 RepID=UPI00398EC61C
MTVWITGIADVFISDIMFGIAIGYGHEQPVANGLQRVHKSGVNPEQSGGWLTHYCTKFPFWGVVGYFMFARFMHILLTRGGIRLTKCI